MAIAGEISTNSDPGLVHPATTVRTAPYDPRTRQIAARVLTVALALGSFIIAAPYAGAIVLGIWIAGFFEPLTGRLTKILRGRESAARAATMLAVTLVVVPAAVVVALVVASIPRIRTEIERGMREGHFENLVSKDGDGSVFSLVRNHAGALFDTGMKVAGASAHALLEILILLASFYAAASAGKQAKRSIHRHVPLPGQLVDRLGAAFRETGRGLVIGHGLTALAQGTCATIAYVCIGVTHPLAFGIATAVAAFLPLVGTAIVWVPLAAALAIAGQTGKAIALVVVGLVLVSTIDNVLRPALSRYGKLDLDYAVLLVAMLGGAAALGVWGLLLGPLIVRSALEALRYAADERTIETALPSNGRTAAAPAPPS